MIHPRACLRKLIPHQCPRIQTYQKPLRNYLRIYHLCQSLQTNLDPLIVQFAKEEILPRRIIHPVIQRLQANPISLRAYLKNSIHLHGKATKNLLALNCFPPHRQHLQIIRNFLTVPIVHLTLPTCRQNSLLERIHELIA